LPKAIHVPAPLIVVFAVGCSSCLELRSASPSNDVHAVRRSQSLTLVTAARSGHWARYRTETDGHDIDLYIARDSTPKPVVILLHGSGCAPLMTIAADGALHDTSLFQDLIAPRLKRLHFVMIEKRGIDPLRFAPGMTQREKESAFERAERECSTEYMQHVTKQERVQDVLSVLRVLVVQPWTRHLILAGHSEGTHVATGVLRNVQGSEITAAGLFASAGPIPFFGGYAAKGASADREAFRSIFEQVRQLQGADDDFMHQGLPARRWKTFWLASTPIEDVRESTVPLFVAQGSRDGSTLSADLFALEAIRQQATRPLRYVVMIDGGHAFETPDGRSRLAELFDDYIGWALDPKKQTAPAVLR
jgi:pimeloyl-ACP methyl ester carboxylesterase